MEVTRDVKFIGVNDHQIDLFEGQYAVENGMSYNSYVIVDEKIAVMDTVDIRFADEWLARLDQELCGRRPDYLVVHHMEPDHSASIMRFMDKYPDVQLVASEKAFGMMRQFFGTAFEDGRVVVGEGDTLSLGRHLLTFVTAPMVHWPEVLVSYESTEKILFSADAFGKFGALDVEEEWTDEARRYYIGIVGKYGAQVQNLLKKAANLDIQMICPLHGPVLKENLEMYLNLYQTWSSYSVETEGVMIAYTSIYGNTKKAVELLEDQLRKAGCAYVTAVDLARTEMSEAIARAFQFGTLVLATSTYNADIFPFMRQFLEGLTERNYQNRTVALIENGSWAPMAAKVMRGMLERSKNIRYAETTVTVRSALSEENTQGIERAVAGACQERARLTI